MLIVFQTLLYTLRRYEATAGHYLSGSRGSLIKMEEMALSFLWYFSYTKSEEYTLHVLLIHDILYKARRTQHLSFHELKSKIREHKCQQM